MKARIFLEAEFFCKGDEEQVERLIELVCRLRLVLGCVFDVGR